MSVSSSEVCLGQECSLQQFQAAPHSGSSFCPAAALLPPSQRWASAYLLFRYSRCWVSQGSRLERQLRHAARLTAPPAKTCGRLGGKVPSSKLVGLGRGGGGVSFGRWIRQVTESWQCWLQGEGISQRLGDSWQFQLFREETGNRLQQTGKSLPNSGQPEAVS